MIRQARSATWLLSIVCVAAAPALALEKALPPRHVLSLDGQWQIEQGSMDAVPKTFSHAVVVPGLADMAQPRFQDVGKKSPLREAFWYRRTFRVDGPLPDAAILKFHKARYGTKAFLNGQLLGEHLPCFTPAYFDVRKHLKGDGQENELIVRVGAHRESLPPDMPGGWDFEKYLYIPGIYDSVELILTGAPYIVNMQVAPDPAGRKIRVQVEIDAGSRPAATGLKLEAAEAKSGKVVGSAEGKTAAATSDARQKLDLTLPLSDCHTWSPEDPFLYELRATTGADAMATRFGMRSFRFDPKIKRAVLNDKTYYLRGSNVCIYRFFEDDQRGDRPWRAEWVRRLHRQFQTMHWNALRYCIGLPPDFWYDIADEEGFLIQDEFPIWLLGKAPENPQADKIIPEYVEWMRQRWNHPCVVIWDGQNESFTDQTGKAIQAVRHLDLSQRPWENGWSEPQSPTDCVESHPYLFIKGWMGKEFFHFKDIAKVSGVPGLNKRQKALDVPILINEYGWLWLNRDGTPTCLTTRIYDNLLGPNSTTAQRRTLYARYLAAKTEFWRCHREVAGVLHFCGLGYSRSGDKPRPEGGATSDHFLDLEQLTLEPLFAEYVGQAFNPVGLMLDFWDEEVPPATKRTIQVFVINDLDRDWRGDVRLRLVGGGKDLSVRSQPCSLAALGREILKFSLTLPSDPAGYQLIAELTDPAGKVIRSLRDFKVEGK